ncbi:hypothetical protein C8F01DRAFT_1121915 [Mycena amicta]|nr:hypothetical protein C8F01DRAFT_1121915 [Mycena amicta]
MPVVSECPNELWLEILQHIPRDQLPSISSTNRLLRQLTRPLLFACLTVRLHIRKPGHKLDGYQRRSILDAPASIDRMRFWMSSMIAPLVCTCVAGSGSYEYVNCPTQVDFFLANLHTLTQLRSLSLWEISIDRVGLATLHQLPRLEELSVDCCELDVYLPCDDDDSSEPCDENSPLPLLRLSKLSIHTTSIAHRPCFYPDWMLVVDPARLRDLALTCDSDDYDFSHLGASNLRMVERLCVDQDSEEPVRRVVNFPPGTLPMLKDFDGPGQLARQLLACSPVSRLTLPFNLDNALDEILSDAPPARNVLALHLATLGVDIARLDAVLRLFPNLTELSVEFDLYETTNNVLHALIWKTVRQISAMGPTSLSSFSLRLDVEVEREEYPDYEDESSDRSDDYDFAVSSTADYTAFIAEVRTRCPGLKDIWIDIESPIEFFAVQWRQLPD